MEDLLLGLVGGVDGILKMQAKADAQYFCRVSNMSAAGSRAARIEASVLKAYRWQYIVSGVMEPRFQDVLGSLIDATQLDRVVTALSPLMYARPDVLLAGMREIAVGAPA